MESLSKPQIDMYVAMFSKEMTFTNKKQQYNFKTKMNNYANKEEFNLTYELFKLCIKQQQQLDSRPVVKAESVIVKKTDKERLLDYRQEIKEMPKKYTKATQMQEFHEIIETMDNELLEINSTEEIEDLYEEVYNEFDDIKHKIIYKFSVPIDDWTWWDYDKSCDIHIYSPQSYQEYLDSMNDFIMKHDGLSKMRMTQFKNEYLKNKDLKKLLESFKTVKG